ncbi:LysR substrate-binding domain-containing protein [Acinetobacter baumannii]|uniref:LysR substrate-binding domain-containing protein n=2 Tax=Acinetobacter baumannii TaxID=470 RepID=UPI0038B41E3D
MKTDLNDLYYFVKVVQHGGFASASREIDIPKSKLSRRILLLEERLGVRLINRNTRQFDVTELGREYYHQCQNMILGAEAAQQVIERNQAEPCGVIRVSCPPAWLYDHIADMISKFMRLYPQVNIHLEVTNKNIDLLNDGIDIALRIRFPPLEDSDQVMKIFAKNPQCIVGHCELVQQHGMPETPLDLCGYPSIGLGNSEQKSIWTLYSRENGKIEKVIHTPRLIVNDMIGVRDAVLRGVGIAQLPFTLIYKEIERGELINLMPNWELKNSIMHAVYPSRKGLLPSVRALLDFLSEEFETLINERPGFE